VIKVARSTVIDAPIDAVWQVLRDFNGHERWHPAVARSHLEAGKHSNQIGAIRSFTLSGGERIREQLLALSDRKWQFRYTIVESDVPLYDYVAEVHLRPVTDGDRTFWLWQSRFRTPPGRERELAELVARAVYEAGFAAIKRLLERPPTHALRPQRLADADALPAQAIQLDRYGSAELLKPVERYALPPGPDEVRIRQTAIGVNFIDVYCRTGYFKLLTPPGVPGMEAAGIVVDVGDKVRHLEPGQRVAYACPPVGAYTSVRTMAADWVIALPDDIDNETAAAGLLKGISAEFLLHRVHVIQPGETVLVFAPAGGVGSLLCQWARYLGATVIGASSSPEKARIARLNGATHVLLPGEKSLEEQVMTLTEGRGVDVIYDALGHDTFAHSIQALALTGHLVSYGQASGDIGAWDIGSLAARSVTLSRPNYAHYTDSRDKLNAICERLFDAIRRRIIKINISARYPLNEAAAAHCALESRATTGSIILLPE